MNRNSLVLAAILSLVGCATAEKVETLGGLGDLDIKIEEDAPVVGARDKAMDNYWEFMAGAKGQPQKVEAMRRLADLEMERSEERFQKQMEVFGQKQDGADTDIQALKDITFRGAIKLYEDALKEAGSGSQYTGLLYQLSKAYEQAGQQEKALNALNDLLAVSLDAPNRDELQFRRGELLFDLKRFKQAELAYGQVIKNNPASLFYEKALTKRGWAFFKQASYQQAISSFLDLVDRKLKQKAVKGLVKEHELSRGDQELVDDVFRVATLSFNELGGAKAIKSYFEAAGHRDYEIRIYQQLAEFYVEKGRIRDASDTYRAYAEVYPLSDKAFEFDIKAIDTLTSAGFASLLIENKKAFIDRYRVNGEYWKHFEEREDTVLAKLRPILQKNSEDIVRHYHALAQKTKSMSAYQEAFVWYRQYLKWFGQSDSAQKLNFLYAELLFEAGHYDLAAKEYEKTAYQYLRFGKNAEAGYAALLSYAEQEKKAEGKQKEIWSRLAVGSALRFAKKFPDKWWAVP